jgi:hypothetical protein
MTAGSVSAQTPGFVGWDVDVPAAIDRIETGWRASSEKLEMGDLCWLANTPKGEASAEGAVQEVNARVGWPPT